MATTDTIVP